jgi:phosphotransferase system enzyme I (PtsI)
MTAPRTLSGTGVGDGVACAPLRVMPSALPEPPDAPRAESREAAGAAVSEAFTEVDAALAERERRADPAGAAMVAAGRQMAADPSLRAAIDRALDEGKTAERAVFEAFDQFAHMLEGLGGMMALRATDLADVGLRVRAHLAGLPEPGVPVCEEPYVLVAEDLAPADTVGLDPASVVGIACLRGGPTSHTSIVARAKGIPAVVGLGGTLAELAEAEGQPCVLDAAAGTLVLAPDAEARAAAEERARRRAAEARRPVPLARLTDGATVEILANCSDAAGVAEAMEAGLGGVGLLRTELAYLASAERPTLAEQAAFFEGVLAPLAGRKAVVRLLDAGSDKPVPFLEMPAEPNPQLGLRGIRALWRQPEFLESQLAALAQAAEATGARVWVMAPMVADAAEAARFVDQAHAAGLPVAGVMAEVPALALMADQVVQACDFLSIGTNDLTQYTLAADRTAGECAGYQDPFHPAVLRLVRLAGEAGQAAGKPVGVCGEAAADPLLATVLVGLGATSLSMAPGAAGPVVAALESVSLDRARAAAASALAATDAAGARAAARAVIVG